MISYLIPLRCVFMLQTIRYWTRAYQAALTGTFRCANAEDKITVSWFPNIFHLSFCSPTPHLSCERQAVHKDLRSDIWSHISYVVQLFALQD